MNDKPKFKLEDLIAEMPEGLPVLQEWDTMPPVGKEWGGSRCDSWTQRKTGCTDALERSEGKTFCCNPVE